jgi:hypothetical protein
VTIGNARPLPRLQVCLRFLVAGQLGSERIERNDRSRAWLKKTEPMWRPSVSDLIAILAVVVAALVWLKQPNWQWGVSVTVAVIAVVIFTVIRHQSQPIRRTLVSLIVIGILIGAAAEPIWKSFRADYPNIAFQWPVTFGDGDDADDESTTPASILPAVIVPQPTIMPAPPGQRPLISSLAKFIFSCNLPKQSAAARQPKSVSTKITWSGGSTDWL